MNLYYTAALISGGLSLLLGFVFNKTARKYGWFMPPVRPRDVHGQPTPRIGGLAVVVSFLVIVVALNFLYPDSLNFTDSRLLGFDRNLLGLLLAVVILSVVNVVDDYRGVPVPIRLTVEVIASWLVVAFGIKIIVLSNPLGGQITLGALGGLLVLLWLVGLSNVTNWLDGVDGLAAGVGAIALGVIFFLSISPQVAQTENALLAAVAFGAIIGFLPFNIGRTQMFLGDTGSVFIGFLIGVLAIISGGKVATAFLVLAIPFLDAIVVFFSRIIHHQSPFTADRRHLHHRFLAMGLPRWVIVLLFYGVSFLFGLIALNTQTIGKVQAALAALVLMTAFVLLYSFGGKIINAKRRQNTNQSETREL